MLIKKELLQLDSNTEVQFKELERSGKIFNANLRKKNGDLHARFFSDGKNYIFYCCASNEWTQRNQFAYGVKSLSADKAMIRKTKEFLFPCSSGECNWNLRYIDTIEECIAEFTYKIHRDKHYQSYLNKKALQEQHFAMFSGLPDDFEDWCCHRLFDDSQYLFFGKKDRNGVRLVTCSSCGASYKVTNGSIQHKASGVCEKCGHSAIYIAERYTGSRKDKRKACICSRKNDTYLFETREVYRSYDGATAKYIAVPIERTLYWPNVTKRKIYKYSYKNIMYYGYDWYRAIDERPTIKAMVYDRNLKGVLPGQFKTEVESALSVYQSDICVPRLVLNLELIPQTEYLLKMGMLQLAAEADRLLFGDGKGFSGAMGVNNAYREMYRQLDITAEEHGFVKNYEGLIKAESIRKMREHRINGRSDCVSLQKRYGVSIEKALRHIEKMKSPKNSADYLLMIWVDYLGMADELKFDLTNASVLYPSDLKAAHDRLVTMINERRMSEKKAQYEQEAKVFAERSGFFFDMAQKCQTKDYVMRIARTRYDLAKEGTELHHCVGSDMYWQRHVKGESLICFIRKRGQEDIPYFTCEITLNSFNGYYISQLYGMKDCKPNAEIRAFAEKFLRMIKPMSRKIV